MKILTFGFWIVTQKIILILQNIKTSIYLSLRSESKNIFGLQTSFLYLLNDLNNYFIFFIYYLLLPIIIIVFVLVAPNSICIRKLKMMH